MKIYFALSNQRNAIIDIIVNGSFRSKEDLGISTGAIIAIIICCLLLLIGATAFAILYKNPKYIPKGQTQVPSFPSESKHPL